MIYMTQSAVRRGRRDVDCWEFTGCGREPGGARADDLGVCPAAADRRFDGINSGTNGGRACWIIAGTGGPDRPEGIFACPDRPCTQCRFYKLVHLTSPTASDKELAERLQEPASIETYCLI